MTLLFITQTTEIQKQTMHVQTRPGPYRTTWRRVIFNLFELADPKCIYKLQKKKKKEEEAINKKKAKGPVETKSEHISQRRSKQFKSRLKARTEMQPKNYRYASRDSIQVHVPGAFCTSIRLNRAGPPLLLSSFCTETLPVVKGGGSYLSNI